MTTLNPYLNFDGKCEEAFEFYRSIFGGEFQDLSRFSEMPGGDQDDGDSDRLIHVALPIGDGQVLMGSDTRSDMPAPSAGDAVHVNIAPDDEDESRRIFEALAEGGTVTMPYERQFWGADFGMCTDKYGINWMVNYDQQA